MIPRAVIVTRPTAYDVLLQAHGTHGQARFWLTNRGQEIEPLVVAHEKHLRALHAVRGAVPSSWRVANLGRVDLDRFLFEPDDLVLAVGQDGLVANVARFLEGQPVIGVNPDPAVNDGVLVQHAPEAVAGLLARAGELPREARTMVEVRTDEGEVLRALNEVFLGHRSHQSARYVLFAASSERQSSSGLIVSTGTGATGWAASIAKERGAPERPLAPTDPHLRFFVREAFASRTTGTNLTGGVLGPEEHLEVRSEMDEGVIFGDGIEREFLPFGWGKRVTVRRSDRVLSLVPKPPPGRSWKVPARL